MLEQFVKAVELQRRFEIKPDVNAAKAEKINCMVHGQILNTGESKISS